MERTILLADDSVTIRKVVELTFSDTGFRVKSVGSGREALAELDRTRPDLVLADVGMPEPSGYEICRRVKRSDRPVPVLLLAGTFESFDPERARQSGSDGCMIKPFESRSLLERVRELLGPTGGRDRPGNAGHVSPGGVAEALPHGAEAAGGNAELTAEDIPCEDSAARSARRAAPGPPPFSAELVDALAQAVVERLSEDVLRDMAREVLPRVAETIVRQRIRELEQEDA